MTPTKKGLYPNCKDCLFKMEPGKYPCILSHKEVRLAQNEYLERNISTCRINNSDDNNTIR